MRRTISIQVYPQGSYTTPLDDAPGNEVRLCYAVPVGNNLALGGIVPGLGFEYNDNGIWERDIDTDIINASRSDYYYLQYTQNSGTTWFNVAGYDPFYFNTKISLTKDSAATQPYIGNKSPSDLSTTESAIAVELSFDGTFTGGELLNDSYIREFYYAFSANNAQLEHSSYTKRTTIDNSITIPRLGTYSGLDCSIHAKLRILNPVTGEVSMYGEVKIEKLVVESVSEILSVDTPHNPAVLTSADIKEASLLGLNDAFTVVMPALSSRGQHSELAIQYGGETFRMVDGNLTSFSGTVIPCYAETITVPKPLFFSDDQTVYLARRIVTYDNHTDWVGKDGERAFEATLSNPAKVSILSDNILDALVNAVIAKTETSTGETLARKS